jgi:hypothetical protein
MANPFPDFHAFLIFRDIILARISFYHQMDAARMSQIGRVLA